MDDEDLRRRPESDYEREQQCAADEPEAGWLINAKIADWNLKNPQKQVLPNSKKLRFRMAYESER